MNIRSIARIASIFVLLICIALAGCSSPASDDSSETPVGKPESLTALFGTATGPSGLVGATIAEIMMEEGVKANAEPGGAVSNVQLVSKGEAEYGITMTIIPAIAEKGDYPFDGKYENIAGVCAFYPNFLHVIVDPSIESIDQLKGKSFASQPVGQASQTAFADLLTSYGLSEDELNVVRGSQTEGAELMKDGHVVGITATTAMPAGAMVELSSMKTVRFLEISDEACEEMSKINPGYVKTTLPANTYPGQDEDIQGVATDLILVARADLSEDEVYWFTKTLAENIDRVKSSHNAMAGMTLESMAAVAGIKMHPGAQRYWDEVLGNK